MLIKELGTHASAQLLRIWNCRKNGSWIVTDCWSEDNRLSFVFRVAVPEYDGTIFLLNLEVACLAG